MKPFNLEEAKVGKPVVTGCNKPVRFLCFDRKHDKFPIVALVDMFNCGIEHVSFYTEEGRLDNENSYQRNAQTLYMKTEKKTGWVLIRKNTREVRCAGIIFHDICDAERLGDPATEVVVKIEWEE